jgi:hypothetical protein
MDIIDDLGILFTLYTHSILYQLLPIYIHTLLPTYDTKQHCDSIIMAKLYYDSTLYIAFLYHLFPIILITDYDPEYKQSKYMYPVLHNVA